MINKKGYFLVLIILVIVSINIIFPVNDYFENLKLINDVHHIIEKDYVNYNEIKNKELTYNAIRGMLNSLDNHTIFFSPDEKEAFISDLEGSFGGIGIRIDKRGDYIVIVSAIEGTPAFEKGLSAGDRIVEVDGESVIGISLNGIMKRIRGKIGTKVEIGIMRKNIDEIIHYEIERQKIDIHSVSASFMISNSIGYIKLTHFNEKALEEMKEALSRLDKKGMRGLILDLRFNPGGLLRMASNITDLFVEEGKKIVYTKGKNNEILDEEVATGDTPYAELPLTVLINQGSASASEIFAGAIRDLHRGTLIGRKTFGKGSVQRIYRLQDDSSVKVTVAYYYTPNGICVDEKGISPDFEIEEEKVSYQLMELLSEDYIAKFSEQNYKQYKIDKNYKISPKPYDDFLKYLEKNNYNFEEKFIKDEILRELVKRAVPEWKEKIFEKIKGEINNRIKYKLITLKYNNEEGRKYLIQDDEFVKKALSVLNKETKY